MSYCYIHYSTNHLCHFARSVLQIKGSILDPCKANILTFSCMLSFLKHDNMTSHHNHIWLWFHWWQTCWELKYDSFLMFQELNANASSIVLSFMISIVSTFYDFTSCSIIIKLHTVIKYIHMLYLQFGKLPPKPKPYWFDAWI